ncbi:serine/threonine-protein kinase-like protein CCR4 [Iris pallida]|uniref:Serine/threonine-protein kinase-like protein CCR4 n=1 Tax=Iris pallida TaxID=29817 RepID=A0AAX6FLE4_IRIPA|nr:serine/threonine-protein kinase-like protein CCR4 [Iris pallida]
MSSRLTLVLSLFIFIFIFSASSSSSSALSTVAISHVGNRTLVCGLLPSPASADKYDLNCTSFPSGKTRYYPSHDVSFSAITAGDGFLCALGTSPSSPSVMLWWDFDHNTHNNSIPDVKKVYQGPSVVSLSAGDSHVCGLLSGGDGSPSPHCWRWPHLPLPEVLNATDIAVGADFVCGLLANGTITCFGDDAGVVGHEPPGKYGKLAAGSSHACGVSMHNELVCWGAGAPKAAKGPAPIDSLALGSNRTCALYVSGKVVCWGRNVTLPKDVSGAQFMAIEARGGAFCGVLTVNYSLVCWGSEVFLQKHVVFQQVLPGSCARVSSCSCGVVPGSGTLCPDGAICRTCSRQSGVNQTQLNSPKTDRRGGHSKGKLILVLLVSIGVGFGTLAAASFVFYSRFGRKSTGRVHDLARLGSRTPTRANAVSPAARPGQESGIERQLSKFLGKGHGATIEELPIRLLLDITDGFSEEHKIGSGSFGSVYRAMLADGRVVAIKRADPSSKASTSRARTPTISGNCKESAFIAEVALLSRVNHKNLVRLLGYCRDGSERILVYEFMSNGTLHSLLHRTSGWQLDFPPPLSSWPARIRVALDAARGIDYLHTYAVPPVIHRDIKSSNILLDDDWTAKVSDFGLSLLTPDAADVDDDDDDRSSGSLCTAGTVGYMDPEYYRLQHLNAKSDVYSFGVVLLEILSGCKAIQKYEVSDSPKNVVEFVLPHIVADDIARVLDKRLAPPTPSEIEAVAFVGYLAADCVIPEGRDRPTMTEIVSGLERALAACTPRSSSSRSMSIESG